MIYRGLAWSLAMLSLMVAASAYGWFALPDDGQFPVHWNAAGDVNRYAGKAETLIMLPVLALVVTAVFAIAPIISPKRSNLEKSRTLYLVGWLGGIALLAMVHAAILYTAVTGNPPLIKFILGCTGVLITLLGNYMAKSRSNWLAGVKTPWTLSSEHAWGVANRFAGRGFAIVGLATIASSLLLSDRITISVLLAGVLSTALMSIAISYFAWRNDPDRGPGANTV